jgi:hypothetical protein
MNLDRLHAIIDTCTVPLREGREGGERDESALQVTENYTESLIDAARDDLEKVDTWFLVVGVDRAKAAVHKAELIDLLKTYPEPAVLCDGLFSYITVGAEMGDRDTVLRLFALGKVLGLWDVVTPATLGLSGERARDAAIRGFIMCTGFKPQVPLWPRLRNILDSWLATTKSGRTAS